MGISTGDPEHDRMLADITARAEQIRETAAGVAANLAETTGTGKSPDGVATATVAPTGALQDIQLSDRAMRMQPAQLSRSIMAAVRAAQVEASQAMVEAFAPLGEGKATMNMILDHIPKPEEDDESETSGPEFAAIEEEEDHTGPSQAPTRPSTAATVPPAGRRAAQADVVDDEDDEDTLPW